MLNSECGNVWGYEGSTGDVDWSFDYHAMMDEFRRHPKVAGWLYTEHHDVVNEWNGYVRADRSEKDDGPRRARAGDDPPRLARAVLRRGRRLPHDLGEAGGDGRRCRCGRRSSPTRSPVARARPEAGARRPRRPRPLPRVVDGRAAACPSRRGRRGPSTRSRCPCRTAGRSPSCARGSRTRPAACCTATSRPSWWGDGPSPRDETGGRDGARACCAWLPPRRLARARGALRAWEAMDGGKQNGAGSGFFEYRLPGRRTSGPRTSRAPPSSPSSARSSSSARTASRGARSRATSCAARAPTTRASTPTPTR